MNFLVSRDKVLIDKYWTTLLANGESQLLNNFSELMWRAATSENALILLDPNVDGLKGIAEISQLKRINHSAKVLVLAPQLTVEDELAALAAGAVGCCGPQLLPEKINHIFSTVKEGGVWISSAALPQLLLRLKRLESMSESKKTMNGNGSDEPELSKLTPREREVVGLIAKGDSNKNIARELNISDRTVKTHLSIIFQKLKVNDRLQLALLVRRQFEAELHA